MTGEAPILNYHLYSMFPPLFGFVLKAEKQVEDRERTGLNNKLTERYVPLSEAAVRKVRHILK